MLTEVTTRHLIYQQPVVKTLLYVKWCDWHSAQVWTLASCAIWI